MSGDGTLTEMATVLVWLSESPLIRFLIAVPLLALAIVIVLVLVDVVRRAL